MSGYHRLIPMLLSCGKESGTLSNQMVSATFLNLSTVSAPNVIRPFSRHYIKFSPKLSESSEYKLSHHSFTKASFEVTKHQLHTLADKRKARAVRANSPAFAVEVDRDEMVLVEEIEDFALEDMGKMLTSFDVNHPLLALLVAIASVRDLGFNTYDSDEEGD